ncbi:hypothetical protein HN011_004996 [Eciton burchellii]|nr:hypothetical protein HN011_004996 [Eciton burchellii]
MARVTPSRMCSVAMDTAADTPPTTKTTTTTTRTVGVAATTAALGTLRVAAGFSHATMLELNHGKNERRLLCSLASPAPSSLHLARYPATL